MKRDRKRPDENSFAERMRERLTRGTDAARRMIDRVRELVETPDAPATRERDVPSTTNAPERAPVRKAPRKSPPRETPVIRQPRAMQDTPPKPESTAPVEIPAEFATATMGQVLLNQGRADEALAVFTRLLARNPAHAEAQRGANAARAALRGEVPPAVEEPTSMLDRAPPTNEYLDTRVHALPVDPASIAVVWEVLESSLADARVQIGQRAILALHVVSVRDGAAGVERFEHFVDDVSRMGNFFVRKLPTGATHHVAVGLRTVDAFAPIAFAEPVATPRGEPVLDVARVRATVEIPPRHDGGPGPGPHIVDLIGPPERIAQMLERAPARGISFVPPPNRRASMHSRDDDAPLDEPPPFAPRQTHYGPPSSMDLVSMRGRWAEFGHWSRSGDWSSSGQWTSSGQWPSGRPSNDD